jgi:hypothetical protein
MIIYFKTRENAREFAKRTGRKAPASKTGSKWAVIVRRSTQPQ